MKLVEVGPAERTSQPSRDNGVQPRSSVHPVTRKPKLVEVGPAQRKKPKLVPVEEPQGRLSSAMGSIGKGAGNMAALTLKGLHAKEAQKSRQVLKGIENLERMKAEGKEPQTIFDVEGRPEVLEYYTNPDRREEIRKSAEQSLEKTKYMGAAEAVEDWVEHNIETNPEFRDEWLTSKIPEGVGSFGAFALASLVTRGTGMGTLTGAAGLGSFSNAGSQFEEALDSGADIETAFEASNIGSLTGLSEAAPVATLLNRFDRASGGSIKRALKNMFFQASEEAAQEFFQTVMDNLTASKFVGYDPERGTLEGSGEAAGVGASVGGLMSFLMSLAETALKRRGSAGRTGEGQEPPSGIHATPEQSIEEALDEDADLTGGDTSAIQTEQDLAESETGVVEDASLTGEDALAEQVESEFGEESAQPTADVVPMAPAEEIVMEGPAPEPPLQDTLERQAETERGLTPAERQRTIQALEQELEPESAQTPISPPQTAQEAGKPVQPESPQDLDQAAQQVATSPRNESASRPLTRLEQLRSVPRNELSGEQKDFVDNVDELSQQAVSAIKIAGKGEQKKIRAQEERKITKALQDVYGLETRRARLAAKDAIRIAEREQKVRQSEATPVRTPAQDQPTPAQQPTTDRPSQARKGGEGEAKPAKPKKPAPQKPEKAQQSDLIGQYVRSGSATGKVTAISDDGKKATLDTGRRVPVGRAPNWAVQSEPFEGAKKRAAKEKKAEKEKPVTEPAKPKKKAAKKPETRETDQGTTMFATAYHGSPHKFDRFDISRIGTGEGHQVYGHGLYLAENVLTGESYYQQFQLDPFAFPEDASNNAEKEAKMVLRMAGLDKEKAKEQVEKRWDWPEFVSEVKDVIDRTEIRQPNLYKVDIPDSAVAKMLDWDKPLNRRVWNNLPNEMKQEIKAQNQEREEKAKQNLSSAGEDARGFKNWKGRLSTELQKEEGRFFYQYLSRKLGSDEAASEYLNSIGVPGIKYLDQGSRDKKFGKRTRNFVIFDDSLITILERNGEPVTGAEREQALMSMQPGDVTQSEAFRRWFQDSKVVDEKGEALVVWHKSPGRFDVFETGREGAHFGTKEQAENLRARGNDEPRAFYLSIQNPLRMPDIGGWSNFNNLHDRLSRDDYITTDEADRIWDAWQRSDDEGWQSIKDVLGEKGYDGIVYENEEEGSGDSYIAFRPEQIKSVDNRGTFSPTDPNILRSETAAQPRGMSVEEVRQQLESRFGKRAIRKLEKSGKFSILSSPNEIEAKLRDRLFGEGLGSSNAGVYDLRTGKSWIFADNVGSGDAVGVFLHEVGAHYGLKRMIGADEYSNVKKRLWHLADEGDQRVHEAIFRVPRRMSEDDPHFWDEVLAYLVQHNYQFKDIPSANRAALKDPLVRALRKVVAQIRAFLNQLGFLNTRNLSSDDIVALVQGAARHAVRTAPKSGVQGAQEATAMSSAPADTFYSQMARALNDKLPNKGTAQSYAKQIRNLAKKGQFKQEELEWSGVLEWLDNFKQTPSRSERLDEEVLGIEAKRSKVVTKAEVLDFLRANRIRVEEVTKSGETWAVWDEGVQEESYFGSKKEAMEYGREIGAPSEHIFLKDDVEGEAKFATYQLPGGESYRELLLTLPRSQELTAKESAELKALNRHMSELTDAERTRARELLDKKAPIGDFRRGHFDESNVLAHVRFNERRSLDGAKKKRERPKSNNFVSSVIAADLPFNVMQSGVVRLMHHDEVRAAVVAAIPADVVDVLKTLKLPPEGLFSDKAVQADFARAPLRDRLNVLLGAATALGNTQARLAAKLRDLLSAGLDQEILPTLRASDLDRGEVRRLLAPTAVNESTETSANGAQLPGARTGTTLRNTASGGTELSAADRARIADRFTHASLGAPSGPSSNLIGVGKVGSSASLTSLLDSHKRIIAERERTDADGNRVLFVEELQSDWLQSGRKKGFRSDAKMAELRRRHEEVVQKRAEETTDTEAYRRLHEEEMALIDEMNVLHDAVPDAPFKTTWPLLAMKRIIRHAAENGFSSVAWTTGEQQAARYDLSKHLMEVRLMKENLDSPYTNLIGVEKSGGKPGIDKMLGKDDSLEDYVGKEIAERLDSLEWKRDPSVSGRAYVKRLTGLDLKVGGEGMKAFYDKMLPSALNKYVKKWGAKVGTSQIETSATIGEHADYRIEQSPQTEVFYVIDNSTDDVVIERETREGAERFIRENRSEQKSVHALPITPQMREAVMEQGQPLFSKGGKLTPEQKRERLRRLGLDFENLPGDLEGSQTRATEPVDQEPDVLSPEEALEELEKQGFDKPMLSVDDDGGEGTLNDPAQQERAQRSLTGNRVTEPETDEYGLIIEDPRIDSAAKEFFLRGNPIVLFESATDKLRRSGHPFLERLAARVDAYYDRVEARMGWVNGRVRPILKRIQVGKKKAFMRDFEEYWRHHDNGREQEAIEVLNRNPLLRPLVTEVKNLYSEMGDLNQRVGVKVYDSSLNEGKGGWRDIGKVLKGMFWPRAIKPEILRVLSNPRNDPVLWRKLVDSLINEGHIEKPSEALKYIRRYTNAEIANDYFSGLERARLRKLPEMFYDYSWNEFNRYSRKWASRVTQIEQFGQKTGADTMDMFESTANETLDQHTRNYISALSNHVYSRRSTDFYTTFLQWLNLLATALQLGNPATATLNFEGGTTLNVQMFGWRRVIKSYGVMMRDWKRIQQTGVDLGILGKDVLNILRDTEQSAATYMDESGRVQDALARFAAFTMKWGGYKGTENIIRMNAMMASWIQLQDALQQWNRNPKGSTSMKYRAFMQRNRIDPDKLLAENGKGPETARYLRLMVNIPQGSYRPDQVPLYVDSPVGRFLFKYQKFGTQVSRMFWQNHLQPFVKTVAGGEKVLLPGQKLQKKTGNIIDEKTGKVVKSNRVRTFLPLLRYFAAAFVGGSAILVTRAFLYNYNDPGPEWDDLVAALDDEDEGEERSLKWALIFDRAFYSMMAASAAGFFGNYIQFGFDLADQQRTKNPLDPPGLASIEAVRELFMRALEQKSLTARDMDQITERTFALYRGYKRMGTKAMAMSGSGWKEARLRDAYTDLVYTKKMTRRFADEMDMKGRRTFSGRWGKTPMSPYNQQAYEALLLGDPESARATYKQARQEMEDPGKVAQSMKSSMRARHPWNVGASQAKANHAKFLQWAEKHTSKANYQRILEIGRRYDKARQGAGL